MRRTGIVMLMLATILIVTPMAVFAISNWMLTSQGWTKVEKTVANVVYGNIRDFCVENMGNICSPNLMQPKDFENRFRRKIGKVLGKVERGKIKADLKVPTLNIYMTFGVLGDLLERREKAFEKGGLAFVDGPKLWVNAEMTAGSGHESRKVKLRLKGKATDHVENVKKMSFRVKVKNGEKIFGMNEFSIHSPRIRQYSSGAIAQDVMKRFGVIAVGTMFADVWINNEFVGIMGLEEHFSKEMLEAQGRRDGAIVAMNDDWDFGQLRLNINGGRDYSVLQQNFQDTLEWDKWAGALPLMPLLTRDYPVQVYNPGPKSSEYIFRPRTRDAISIFRDVIDGRRPGFSVYDYNLLARFWIISHAFSGQHGLLFIPNRRHYFNPITGRLEPVSYDLNVTPSKPCLVQGDWMAYSHWEYPCAVSDPSIRSIWDSPRFRDVFWEEANHIREELGTLQFQKWFTSTFNRYEDILRLDGITSPALNIKHLENNLEVFLSHVREKFLLREALVSNVIDQTQEESAHDVVTNKNHEIMTALDILHTHIRPFWFRSKRGIDVELKNLTPDPVFVHSVFSEGTSDSNVLPNKIVIPPYRLDSNEHISQIQITGLKLGSGDQLWMTYSHKNKIHTRPIIWQVRNYETGYASGELMARWFRTNNVDIDRGQKTIVFPPGDYSLPFSMQTTTGWQVKILAGAVLKFQKGVRLRVNGPIHLLGNKETPVKLVIKSDISGALKSWGGLLVVNAEARSTMLHALVFGAGETKTSDRRDAKGLTGCVTFYKSDVTIKHSRFEGLHCEDALNIVHSKFEVDDLEIYNSNADALDSDFSEGKIVKSKFGSNRNDDLDLSGSNVELYSSNFFGAGDKTISVGEGSTLEVRGITIKGATAGIVSKDQSVVNVWASSLADVDTGLMAYWQKDGWGPAILNCYDCLFKHVGSVAVKQSSSTITLDGENVWAKPFSLEQLRIAGYVGSDL